MSAHSTEIQTHVLAADALQSPGSRVRHGFFTRLGGLSTDIFRGLNVGLGSSDDPATVRQNRALAMAHFGAGPGRLCTLHQIHSVDVVAIDEVAALDRRPKADAMVTNRPGLVLGILTADCGPVLFANPRAGVIGAAHAGWKGALGGVLENTIAAMEQLGAKRAGTLAVLGPTISKANYEVGEEFVDTFTRQDPRSSDWFANSDRQGHALFDLPGYIVARLKDAGVTASALGDCTYADEARFFSYRRTTHRGEPDYGRQLSAIMIED